MATVDNRAVAEGLIEASKNLSMWARMNRTQATKLAGFNPGLASKLEGLSQTMDGIGSEIVDALAAGIGK